MAHPDMILSKNHPRKPLQMTLLLVLLLLSSPVVLASSPSIGLANLNSLLLVLDKEISKVHKNPQQVKYLSKEFLRLSKGVIQKNQAQQIGKKVNQVPGNKNPSEIFNSTKAEQIINKKSIHIGISNKPSEDSSNKVKAQQADLSHSTSPPRRSVGHHHLDDSPTGVSSLLFSRSALQKRLTTLGQVEAGLQKALIKAEKELKLNSKRSKKLEKMAGNFDTVLARMKKFNYDTLSLIRNIKAAITKIRELIKLAQEKEGENENTLKTKGISVKAVTGDGTRVAGKAGHIRGDLTRFLGNSDSLSISTNSPSYQYESVIESDRNQNKKLENENKALKKEVEKEITLNLSAKLHQDIKRTVSTQIQKELHKKSASKKNSVNQQLDQLIQKTIRQRVKQAIEKATSKSQSWLDRNIVDHLIREIAKQKIKNQLKTKVKLAMKEYLKTIQ